MWYQLRYVFFGQNLTILVAAGPIFFSRILIIMEIRLKFESTGHLTLSNMSKLIPHFSNHQKIVFWPWSGVKWGKINMCHKIKKFSNGLMNHFLRYWVKNPKFDDYHTPISIAF